MQKVKNISEIPTAQELLDDDLKAIKKQLAQGKPLQFHQRQKLEFAMGGDETFARNYNALAAVLGVSRQLIAWHNRKPDAPQPKADGRHDVAEWREYLVRVGRIDAPCGVKSRVSLDVAVENAMASLYWRISDALPAIVHSALVKCSLTAPAEQRDALALLVWLGVACIADTELTQGGMDGIFEGEDGEVEYPAEILKLCGRIEESETSTTQT